jgi:histidinol-phosphate phosphatase family protein
MGCDTVLTPHRDDVELTSSLQLPQLPNDAAWDGSIAYLDRDGVIIEGSENYVNTVDEVVLLPDSAKSVGDLRRAGYRICVVTNQSPINRGLWSNSNLSMIHDRMGQLLLQDDGDAQLDLILYSPYAPWEGAWARKPFPGMLEAGRQLIDAASSDTSMKGLELKFGDDWINRPDESTSVMVGDRGVDMSAAARFGVDGILCDSNTGISGVIDSILGDSY